MKPARSQKFTRFSGMAEFNVDFKISWTEADIPSDTDSIADACDDAMMQCFNSAAYFGAGSDGVLYNGMIAAACGPLRQSGGGWRQRLPYRFQFEVVV
jgi:hypothetical protein